MKLKKSCICSKVCTFVTQHDTHMSTSYKSCTRSCSPRHPPHFESNKQSSGKLDGAFTHLCCFCLKFQCACENLFCSQTSSIRKRVVNSVAFQTILALQLVCTLKTSTITSCFNLLRTFLFVLYSTPKNLKQFFYVQETNELSYHFIQFLLLHDDGQ